MNAAETSFAETIGVAHAALLEELHRLDEALRGSVGKEMLGLTARLEAIDRELTEHFRFEEDNGYIEMVRKLEPYRARTIQRLIEEHHLLTKSLKAIIEETRTARRVTDPFRAKVLAWINSIEQHEAREDKLIEDVYYRGLGTAD